MRQTVLILMLFCAPFARAQSGNPPGSSSSSVPSDAKYEIVSSSLFGVNYPLRLNRGSGAVDILWARRRNALTWHLVKRLNHSLPVFDDPGKVNYQIYQSGFQSSFQSSSVNSPNPVLLMNRNTGATWALELDLDAREWSWVPVK